MRKFPADLRHLMRKGGGGAAYILTLDIDNRYHDRMSKPAELLQGTLDLMILRTLECGPLHGVGISDRIEQVTHGVFVVGPGSLFRRSTGSRKKDGWRANGAKRGTNAA